MDSYLSSFQWRYATKVFDPSKHVSDEAWGRIKEAIRLAPSSFGLQPWKFIEVTDKALREKIKAASWNQTQVTDADKLLVLCSRTDITKTDIQDFLNDTAKTRGVTAESLAGYQQVIEGTLLSRSKEELAQWAARQVYIAQGFALAAAALEQVDSCPMEGFDAKVVAEILGTESLGFQPVVMIPFGYRSAEDHYAGAAKVRYGAEKLFIQRS